MKPPIDILEDDLTAELSQLNSFLRDFRNSLEPLAQRQSVVSGVSELLSLLPIWNESEGRPNRRIALELADLLSTDERQQLYRFAVLVTKLGN